MGVSADCPGTNVPDGFPRYRTASNCSSIRNDRHSSRGTGTILPSRIVDRLGGAGSKSVKSSAPRTVPRTGARLGTGQEVTSAGGALPGPAHQIENARVGADVSRMLITVPASPSDS